MTSSTPAGPAATTPARSTSRRPRPSSPAGRAWPSRNTAVGRPPATAARRTSSRRSAWPSTWAPDEVGRCLDEVGIGFMSAPLYHPAMKHAAQTRREIGIRTVFNILGPLTNPAGAPRPGALGTPTLTRPGRKARRGAPAPRLPPRPRRPRRRRRGRADRSRERRASIEVADGRTEEWFVSPGDVGVAAAALEDVAGGEPGRERGDGPPGPRRSGGAHARGRGAERRARRSWWEAARTISVPAWSAHGRRSNPARHASVLDRLVELSGELAEESAT